MEIHVLPSRAATDLLEIATKAPSGNPWQLGVTACKALPEGYPKWRI